MRFKIALIEFAEFWFSVPHDWWIVELGVKLITPKKVWDYYGNPLCYAYCACVSHFFFRLWSKAKEREEF